MNKYKERWKLLKELWSDEDGRQYLQKILMTITMGWIGLILMFIYLPWQGVIGIMFLLGCSRGEHENKFH